MTKICIINVGANSSHRTLRSALFPDGAFEFIPIPDPCLNGTELGVKYSQLRSFNDVPLSKIVSQEYFEQCTHNDPEFDTFTYGDYPTCHARAANLKRLKKGDYLFFFARLVPWQGKFCGNARFALIGFLEIEKIHRDITRKPVATTFHEIRNNAHVIRGETNSFFYDGFWVFKGSDKSMRFNRAVTFDRNFITECGIKNTKGQEIEWHRFRSELATIGSYFRSSRLLDKSEQIDAFWDKVLSKCF